MASLSHHAAALMTLSLLAGCGGDRSRAGAGTDTTGATAGRDTAASTVATAAPTSDTGARDTSAAVARDTATRPAAVAPAPTAKPKASVKKAADTAKVQKAESTKSAAAPAPAPTSQQQDTSSQTAEAPLIDAYHQPPKDTVSQAVYDGWKQFNLNCARCHGEDALGTTIAPHLIVSLKPDGPINTKELFVQTVCAGRPAKGMPSWCALGLDMEKINNIYLYVKGRSDAKISPGRPAVKKEG
jgi:mono/diheme cytochrome c family protein